MKRALYVFLLFMLITLLQSGHNEIVASNGIKASAKQQNIRIGFIENKGQIIDQQNNPNSAVLYLLNTPGMNVQLRKNGFSYDLYQLRHKTPNTHSSWGRSQGWGSSRYDSIIQNSESGIQFHRIDIDLVNANPKPAIETSIPSSDYLNFYTTGTPVGGITTVRNYATVTYKDIYPGIDLKFNADSDRPFEYNFILQPGADINLIKLKVYGPQKIKSYREGLHCETTLGEVEETIPVCYYRLNDVNVAVRGKFKKIAEHIYGFATDQAIPAGAVLLIDPIPTRLWGTYYGGSEEDNVLGCATDNFGNVFISGKTSSPNNIATAGAFQTTQQGLSDAFLVKFNSSGQRLWGTYYGGPGGEDGCQCAVDKAGNIYLAGDANPASNVTTPGCFQPTYGGGADIFLAKFNTSGYRIWSTFYGGRFDELEPFCTTDQNCNVYLCLQSNSDSLATSGTYQEHPNGDMDCLLAKFDSSGQRIWATYFGGAGNDWPYSCAVDIYGHIYLSGYTSSSSLIATPGSHQEVYGGDGDAFLARFDTTGQLVWATYYGGNCVEFYGNCAVGPNGEVYLSGETCSSNNISTPGSHQPDEGGSFDGFLAKFDSSGIQQWGTYYGGNQQDYFWACFVDATGNVLAAGGSESSNGISTTGSYQPYNAGIDDAILVKFLPSGQLLWGTYYGGSDVDLAREIAIDINNNIYVVGQTSSTNNIASPNAQQDTLGGGEADGFLVKFEDCPIPSPAGSISGQANICPPETAVYTVPLIDYATGYTWTVPTGCTIISGADTNTITVDFGLSSSPGTITVLGTDTCGSGALSSLGITLYDRPVITISGTASSCTDQTYTYETQAGMTQYLWTVSPGTSVASGGGSGDSTITVSWNTMGIYWIGVNYTNPYGCDALSSIQENIQVNQSDSVKVSISASQNNVCAGTSIIYIAVPTNGGTNPAYQWKVNGVIVGTNNSTYLYTPVNGDIITCQLTSSLTGCLSGNPATSNAITVTVNPLQPVSVNVAPSQNPVCAGLSVTFTATPTNRGTSPTYQWKVNGTGVGTNSSTYTYTPVNGDIVTCVLTSNATCTTGNPATSNAVTMTVNPNLAVSISISVSSNPFCLGSSVTFTATPTNGGTSPSYQWKVNGTGIGTNSSTCTYVPNNNDVVTCDLNSNISCPISNPVTSNSITMTENTGLPAGVTIAASDNPFCPGALITFTATPTNGGTSPTYQWKVNGVNAGTNSSTYSYNPNNGDSVRCVMTSNLNCVTNNPASSVDIIMSGNLAPIVTFTSCFDTITTVNAKPIKLKGGIPLGGIYSGPGVNSLTGIFTPSSAGTGTKTITYTYTNVSSCSTSKTIHIIVQATAVFTCGNTLTDIRDNKTYATIQIGSQCWMAANLNYGTILVSTQDQRDNCLFEKYCYNDNLANCTNLGALYQWDELMQYDNTPADQGFCPPGWHIPTENDWNTLFAVYINNGFAGSPLKFSGFSGFNALLAGENYYNTSWDFKGFATFFWSSTLHSPTQAWAHGMNDPDPSVSVYPASRGNAFSVRCVHD